ncbi:hypothetical protein PIB30_098379 [Stylosanthes scabra]|uniref:Putative plant transposon protein domain-containing protein n=1 Tax=Stylosanthes scabra TaxID=79078 RepID=A0ABU6ZV81_9FABA|nr:hypothetical protein [Stylosanthes scabra]
MTKGWYKFVCRSILPTTNRSELTVERAMLIHSIIIGENINVEEIIAEQIYNLPFPSIIAALCADAKIPAIPDDTLIPQEPPIVAEAMVSTLILTPPCPKSTENVINIKKRIGGASRPSTQGWTKWMINWVSCAITTRQFKEMEMQGIPVNMANLAIHTQREEEMNQESMRSERILQEAAAQ